MKCPTCEGSGERSKVYLSPAYRSQMSIETFYDEDGDLHTHDPNEAVTHYRCTSGHHWTSTYVQECHECKRKGAV